MRIAVISDIHANLHALEAVLAAVDADGVDELWCLGDLVGYGPRPNECVALVRERASTCLVGNHDLAVLGRLDLESFADEAAAAAAWTTTVLDADVVDVSRLPRPRCRASRASRSRTAARATPSGSTSSPQRPRRPRSRRQRSR